MYTDYFLDSENLGSKVLDLVDFLDASDKLYIFYSDKSQRPSYEFLSKVMDASCTVKVIECENGTPNSMDFKIVSFLGLKIGGYKNLKKNKHHYVILSGDTGYDTTITFYRSMGIDVERRTYMGSEVLQEKINAIISEQPTDTKKQKQKIKDQIVKVEISKSLLYETIIRDCIKKSNDVIMFHNTLNKSANSFIKQNASSVYRLYKKEFLKAKKA